MSVKLHYLIIFAAVLFGLYGSASAADNHWLGTAGDNEWGNVDNWEGGHVPDAVLWPTEEAEVGYTTVGAGPILGVGDVGSAYRIFLGQNDGDTMYGELTMDGGTITTSGYMSTAYHEGTSALITVNSGSVYIGDPEGSNGHLYLGRAGSAILNINGGSFTADDNIELGKNDTGYGEINLAGGTLQAGTLKLGTGAGLVNITGGTLILVGDDTADVQSLIELGSLVADAGAGTLDYFVADGLTIVTSVTEKPPAVPTSFVLAGEKIIATASSAFSAEEGPEKTINGSGLDAEDLHSYYPEDMWISDVVADGQPTWIQYEFDGDYLLAEMLVWNHNTMVEDHVGFGIKNAVIEYSLDGAAWTTLGETHEFARADGEDGYAANTTVDFGRVLARHVRITAQSNWGEMIGLGLYGLSEVRFMYFPAEAHNPDPAPETANQDPRLTLSWLPGGLAVSHNVYLATDEQSVIDGTALVANVTEAEYSPLSLELGETYYWRVDGLGGADGSEVWTGDVWSFSTKVFLAVDDFEDYTDEEGKRIFDKWADGFTNNTGSVAGYENAPFAERTIVYGGRQSMPLVYNNAGSPWYSEVERTWEEPWNFTAHATETLNLYFRSDPNSAPAALYVAVQDSDGIVTVVTHPDGEAAVGLDEWKEWMIPLSVFTDAGANMASVKTLYVGVGDRINPAAGGAGTIYIDEITLNRSTSVSVVQNALEFDGVDDYVETPISNVPKNGTVEAWIRTTSQDREAVISSYGGDQEFRVHLNYQPGKSGSSPGILGLNVRFRTLTAYVGIGEEMYDGSWHHVAFVWEGDSPGTIRSYWDGQEKTVTYREQNEWAGNYDRSSVHVIGREDLNNDKYFFAGMIDEVRFWEERARTESEIQEYMSRELMGNEEGLTGYWKFNEASGMTAYDSSPNGNNGIISGAVSTADAAPVAP